MAKPKKHSQKLINQAHEMAFKGELTNAQIAKKLKLTKNQLAYIIYQCKSTTSKISMSALSREIVKEAETLVAAQKARSKAVKPKSFHVDKAKPKPKVEPQEEKTMLAKAFDWLLGT